VSQQKIEKSFLRKRQYKDGGNSRFVKWTKVLAERTKVDSLKKGTKFPQNGLVLIK